MTHREIQIAVEKINRRTHNNYCLSAAMHGAKNVSLIPSASFVDVDRSEVQNKIAEQALKEAQQRKQKEWAKRGK